MISTAVLRLPVQPVVRARMAWGLGRGSSCDGLPRRAQQPCHALNAFFHARVHRPGPRRGVRKRPTPTQDRSRSARIEREQGDALLAAAESE